MRSAVFSILLRYFEGLLISSLQFPQVFPALVLSVAAQFARGTERLPAAPYPPGPSLRFWEGAETEFRAVGRISLCGSRVSSRR
jgi:hypothetical protein